MAVDAADPPKRGRPRDPTIDARVLAATAELLATEGFSAATVQEIARRAGVPSSAIYRRWPSRVELIEDAVYPGPGPVAFEPTGDLLVLVAVWVDPGASDETAVRIANRESVRRAIGVCVEGRDPVAAAALVARRDELTSPFYSGG